MRRDAKSPADLAGAGLTPSPRFASARSPLEPEGAAIAGDVRVGRTASSRRSARGAREYDPVAAWLERDAEDRVSGRIGASCVALSLLLHVALFSIALPAAKSAEIAPASVTREPVTLRELWLPPPTSPPPVLPQRREAVRVPIPDPDPDSLPVPESERVTRIGPDLPLPESIVDLSADEPPGPPAERRILWPLLDGVTEPVLVQRTEPDYPPTARRARIPGKVILRAVIGSDGGVRDVEVLSAPRPDLGFAAAATSAVREWRYEPATQGERPVNVYFTVVVRFTIE